jgi:hypothetical protein
MSNPADTVVPMISTNGQESLVSNIGMLIGHVQSIIAAHQAEPARESASDEQSSDDFFVLDDISPRHVAASDESYACNARRIRTFLILLDTETSREAHRTIAHSLPSPLSGYDVLFRGAFPRNGLSPKTIVEALATYERTVVSERAPFDAWIEGDERAISEQAKRGFAIFNTRSQCSSCHEGWNFTNDGLHDIGLSTGDLGRARFLPTAFLTATHRFQSALIFTIDISQTCQFRT